MKKAISLVLCVLLALCCMCTSFAAEAPAGFGEYAHVFIIGIDGAGAAFGLRNTPNFDRIFADNAYRHNAHTEYVTISAQNWGSILTGVDYETHGFTNESTGVIQRGSDTPNHSVFYYTRRAFPDARLVSICHWRNINHGIIENDLHVRKVNRLSDALVTDAICRTLERGEAPKLMFVQLDDVDHAAHTYGGFSDEYYAAVEKMDIYLGEIFDAVESKGLMQNSLFIVVADHGETTYGHGGQTPEESAAVVAVAGHSVNQTILAEGVHNRDVAAIALHALGIAPPDDDAFVATVPADLFGESRAKTAASNPMPKQTRLWRDFLYFFLRIVNVMISPFDKR